MNSIIALPIAGAVQVASPAMALMKNQKVQFARLEQAIESLRTRHVCDGWKIDEVGAERSLRYFSAGCPDNDDELSATMEFMLSHGLSLDWIWAGDVSSMTCSLARHSRHALAGAAAIDPIFAVINKHRRAVAAYDILCVEEDALDEEIPKEKRRSDYFGDEVNECPDDDPRWIAFQREMKRLSDDESAAECELANITPTTLQGVMALLTYAAQHEARGVGWQDLVDDEESNRARPWCYFVNKNIVQCLQKVSGVGA